MHSEYRLSIVVPVLNEASILDDFLKRLRAAAPAAQIIVADGGSEDASYAIAEPTADVVLRAPRGRARQMNAGAERARGEVLWFLHADLSLPENPLPQIDRTLGDPRIIGGCFRLRFPRPELIYRISDSLGNVGVEVFGFALGDHGIFCRRSEFVRAGGYPDVPILEDAELYRRLNRLGRMIQLRDKIVCSPRAYGAYGPYRTTAVYFVILALYVLGAPISFLNRVYRRFRRRMANPLAPALARTSS